MARDARMLAFDVVPFPSTGRVERGEDVRDTGLCDWVIDFPD